MKKNIAFLLSICLFAFQANAQDDALDSLNRLLHRTKNDTARIGLYTEMSYAAADSSVVFYSDTAIGLITAMLPASRGKTTIELQRYWSNALYYRSMFFSNGEMYDTALYYLEKAMGHALTAKDRLQEARIINDMAVCFYRKNNVVKAVEYFRKSLDLREELNDDEQLRNAYNNTAFIYKETGLIDQSLELNFKALALSEKRKNNSEIALSFNNIGQLYHKYLMDKPRALDYYKKGLAIAQTDGDKKATSLLKNNIGALYGEMGQYREALRWYRESLQLRREINYKFGITNTLSSLAFGCIKTGDFDSARIFLAEAAKMNLALKDKTMQTFIHRNYAELYKTINNTDSALYHANLSHQLNLEGGNPLNISSSAVQLSGLYENKGDYRQALAFYKLHKKMQDSISNDDLKKEGIKSDIEYQYLKKQNESDKVHGRQLAKRNLYTWLLVVLFAASAFIGFVLYKRYRLKQRLKEVEIRNKIAADLHDDVGSTLSSIRMYSDIVKQQPNQTDIAVQLLSKISSNSKETIETMSDIVWMIKPGNDAFTDIENRMLNFANELCTPAGINFEMNKNEMPGAVKIPMEQRRDIYLIFKEAINNAVKYAGCHFIRASIQVDKTSLKMAIADDGNGFNMAQTKNGNGLSNMNKRAAAHKGNCSVQSKEGAGTEIEVWFSL